MSYIVFFPRTGTARVFDSYNLAQATYPRQTIISSVKDIPLGSVLAWYEALFEQLDAAGTHFNHGSTHVSCNGKVFPKLRTVEGLPTEELCHVFWELAVTCGNRVTRYAPNNETSKRSRKKASGYRVDLVRANEVLVDPAINLPQQARAIVEFLTESEFDHYTRDEMIKTCNGVAFLRKIKTRQDPWRIWRYYGPLLTKHGVIR